MFSISLEIDKTEGTFLQFQELEQLSIGSLSLCNNTIIKTGVN